MIQILYGACVITFQTKKYFQKGFKVCQKVEGISVAGHVHVNENEDAASHSLSFTFDWNNFQTNA
jgi:hypothetical protein